MKQRIAKFRHIFVVLAALCLLMAAFSIQAMAANPGEIELDLTYNGGSVNGSAVASGNVALVEDGVQISPLYPISGGKATIAYSFNASKSYELVVQEAMAEPYYKTKTFTLSSSDISTAISSGLTITDTVDYVEWTKALKVSLVDSMGLPVALDGVEITVTGTDNDPVNPTYQVFYVTKPTNDDGFVKFLDFSYDMADPNNNNGLNNILPNIFASAVYTDAESGKKTTVAQFYDLSTEGNEVELVWPDVTVSGYVYDANGAAMANRRVAAYFDVMKKGKVTTDDKYHDEVSGGVLCNAMDGILKAVDDGNDSAGSVYKWYELQALNFTAQGRVYYTTTDDYGKYTLSLPQGAATICVSEEPASVSINQRQTLVGSNADYVVKATAHFPWMVDALPSNSYTELNADGKWKGQMFHNDYDPNKPEYEGALWGTVFTGLHCVETAPLVCTPYYNLTGQNLSVGREAYTLKATVMGASGLYNGRLYLNLKTAESTGSADVHSVTFTETSFDDNNVTNGAVNKEDDVKMVPGEYTAKIYDLTNEEKKTYGGYNELTVNITSSDIADDGVVDLGVLKFEPYVKTPPNPTPKPYDPDKPKPTPIEPKPPVEQPNDWGHGEVPIRIEQMEDPAYGTDAHVVTLHYTPHHTNAAESVVDTADFTIELPIGVSVINDGGFAAAGTSATGITLTQTLTNLTVGENVADVLTIVVKVDDDSAANYYAITAESKTYDDFRSMDVKYNAYVTFQRLRVNLSAPRMVEPATAFRVFGDITGAGESGIELNQVGVGLAATGAKKGRYYYFDVQGKAAGSYDFQAKVTRNGSDEYSNVVSVDVAAGLPKMTDVFIERGSWGGRVNKNAAFDMVYYTAFVNSYDLSGPTFVVYVKLDNVSPSDTVNVNVMGTDYPATYDATTGYWNAVVSGYGAYGDYDINVNIKKSGVDYSTQIGRLLLLF